MLEICIWIYQYIEFHFQDPATCLISRHVLSTIQSALVSSDRARVLAALELLNKLAQNEANEDALLRALEAKVRKQCADTHEIKKKTLVQVIFIYFHFILTYSNRYIGNKRLKSSGIYDVSHLTGEN